MVEMVAKVVETKSHRLWVVDKEGKPIGVVSLTQVRVCQTQRLPTRPSINLTNMDLGSDDRLHHAYRQGLVGVARRYLR